MATFEKVSYMFIDGGYLDSLLDKFSQEFFNGESIEIHYGNLKYGNKRAFYYNALPGQRKTESDYEYELRLLVQINRYKEIGKLPGFHFREGVVRRESKKNIQKKVDILMAVDMLSHTIAHNMDQVVLLTGDLDFQPVLDALVQAGIYTRLIYLPENTSDELISSADESYPINIETIKGWSTESFRNKFKYPQLITATEEQYQNIENHLPLDEAKLIKKGILTKNQNISLFEINNIFTAVFSWDSNPDYLCYLTHNDPVILEKYILSRYGSVKWN
jgi:uncharacterized LabA/DUF88 family protein